MPASGRFTAKAQTSEIKTWKLVELNEVNTNQIFEALQDWNVILQDISLDDEFFSSIIADTEADLLAANNSGPGEIPPDL